MKHIDRVYIKRKSEVNVYRQSYNQQKRTVKNIEHRQPQWRWSGQRQTITRQLDSTPQYVNSPTILQTNCIWRANNVASRSAEEIFTSLVDNNTFWCFRKWKVGSDCKTPAIIHTGGRNKSLLHLIKKKKNDLKEV